MILQDVKMNELYCCASRCVFVVIEESSEMAKWKYDFHP